MFRLLKIARSMVSHYLCRTVEHVCTLYTYPIRTYRATIYKNMEFVAQYIRIR